MLPPEEARVRTAALEDFRRARRRASLEQITARLQGRTAHLLPYEKLRPLLKSQGMEDRGLQEIPLDAIVGSVGRYDDFTRSFLPKHDSNRERWAQLRSAEAGMGSLPPIDVYQVGDAYFVLDGNHRVSVARDLGADTIYAHVVEVLTNVELTPEDSVDQALAKARYAQFLEESGLAGQPLPVDLTMTAGGNYQFLYESIAMHRRQLSDKAGHEVPLSRAAHHWLETVYMPVAQLIREYGVLRDFPERTEADLFVWLMRHRAELEEEMGWEMTAKSAAVNLMDRWSRRPLRVMARLGRTLRGWLLPPELDEGPAPGQWRRERVDSQAENQLFAYVVALIVECNGRWPSLDQAIQVARREQGHIHGLHVARRPLKPMRAEVVRERFLERCRRAGIPADFALDVGDLPAKVTARARWTDLLVVNYVSPPAPQIAARLRSPLHNLLQRCMTPILAVPGGHVSPLSRALLAFDGSRKAEEALFVATYLASHWRIPLVVVTISADERQLQATVSRATDYLSAHQVQATFVPKTGEVGRAIVAVAREQLCDFIIMGGYGSQPALELVLGSAVNDVLRHAGMPVLICR